MKGGLGEESDFRWHGEISEVWELDLDHYQGFALQSRDGCRCRLGERTFAGDSHVDGAVRDLSPRAGADHAVSRHFGVCVECGGGADADRDGAWVWTFLAGDQPAGGVGAYFLARRQALKDHEEFWSPPTKRVTQALLPPLLVGALLGVMFTFVGLDEKVYSWAMPITWMFLYGCAVHAAGFFMPRGMKLLAWVFLLGAGSLLLSSLGVQTRVPIQMGHVIMGVFFGGLHLLYGVYLLMTDKPGRSS